MKSILMMAATAGCVLMGNTFPVNPTVGVEMSRQASGYVVSYQNCFDPKMVLDLKAVTVKKVINGHRADSPLCRVWWADFDVRSVKEWTYGTVPTGYKSDRCQALAPGETYEVLVSAGAGGVGVFSIATDGSVNAVKSACN